MLSCSQGGVRKGSASCNYVIWHAEVEDLLVLKNNKGTEDNRVRRMDYVVQVNKLFYERLITGGNITLFSPSDVPGLYEAFYRDQDEFRSLYEKYERSTKIKKKVVSATELWSAFMRERKETGRVYLMNVDHVNSHGSFIPEFAPVRMTNLCCEVVEPTKPLNDINDAEGEIALCVLSAGNFGSIREPKDLERPCTLAVRALDELLDFQDYIVPAAKTSMMKRRMLGNGLINLAYFIAKNDLTYQNIDKVGLQLIHEYAEAWSYYLIKASIDLAKEKGPCPGYYETNWSLGLLPIDTYKREVDEIVDPIYKMDWESLRVDLKLYGIRNSTLMAGMPAETSSALSNATNGFEPVRALITNKGNKDLQTPQVVPEYRKLKNKYDLLWDQKSPEGYLKICAVFQKFMDQSISVNTSYNPKHYENEEIPLSVLLQDVMTAYRLGLKTLYYHNDADGSGEQEVINEVSEEVDEEFCEACTL